MKSRAKTNIRYICIKYVGCLFGNSRLTCESIELVELNEKSRIVLQFS